MHGPVLETPADEAGVDGLLDRCFGPDRHLKTCQRLRDGQTPADGLAFVLRDDIGRVIATLRFWETVVGGRHRALLLGPLAVMPEAQSLGLGGTLIRHGLAAAEARGHGAVILVGDEPYYRRFGFRPEPTLAMELPGPVDRARFLGLDLREGALAGAAGMVAPFAASAPVVAFPTAARPFRRRRAA
jgi:predicted N-acetyltransferase YhbS